MTRRALFAALASLPFVGRFVRKPAPVLLVDSTWSRAKTWNPGQVNYRYVNADGTRTTVHFARDRETGRWHELLRYKP